MVIYVRHEFERGAPFSRECAHSVQVPADNVPVVVGPGVVQVAPWEGDHCIAFDRAQVPAAHLALECQCLYVVGRRLFPFSGEIRLPERVRVWPTLALL